MDERYWAEVIRLMRSGLAHVIALDMAFDALELRAHFMKIERQRTAGNRRFVEQAGAARDATCGKVRRAYVRRPGRRGQLSRATARPACFTKRLQEEPLVRKP